jgi:hypothetical protein
MVIYFCRKKCNNNKTIRLVNPNQDKSPTRKNPNRKESITKPVNIPNKMLYRKNGTELL